ncbi:MAG TPA: recombinase family protein, partial [Symbiobacteriaceae bacterium]|nr:recombinase family protein [Symbiobacteriaceae bacterium]
MKRRNAASTPVEQAGLYVRVSLDRAASGLQDEILSPDTQEDRGRQYCGAQGWTVALVERDIDESAYRQHYSCRAGLMRLLEAVDRREISKIVVWKFSRLSRRLKEFIEICDRLEAAGAGVVSVTEQVDTSTPAGRLIRNILASFAQFQSEEISEQIFESWRTKAMRGERPPGLAPFGTVNNRGVLEPHPETHAHLLAIYRLFVETGSVRAVWDYLAAQGVPAPRAAGWSLNTIRGILTNPVYIGRIEWAGDTYDGRWAPLVPVEL